MESKKVFFVAQIRIERLVFLSLPSGEAIHGNSEIPVVDLGIAVR